ncbi:MAG TPA: hypothetical protein VFQ53_25025 [Kofleriaceae bacterium]|nr:hypothetical protein [Kofleriaceae bacterium]
MFSKSGFTTLATLALVTGCLKNPATGVPGTGAPLRVQYSTGTGTYVSNDVVSSTVHKDADGNEVGTSETYEEREHSFKWNDWKYFQGPDELDEQDYYRIAGDTQAADQVDKIRAGAARKMKVGAVIAAASVVAGIAAAVALNSGDSSAGTTVGYTLGTMGATGGMLVWYWGANDMKKPHHLPMSRADRNADVVEDCNEGRCIRMRGGRQATAR